MGDLRTVFSFRDITPYTLTRGLTARACIQLSRDITPQCYPRHYSGVARMTPLNNSNTAAYFRGAANGESPRLIFRFRIAELREGESFFTAISRGVADSGDWIMASMSRVNRLLNELEFASGCGLY